MTAVGPYRSRTRDFFMDRFDFQKRDEFFAKLLEYLLKLACMISILYTPYSVLRLFNQQNTDNVEMFAYEKLNEFKIKRIILKRKNSFL